MDKDLRGKSGGGVGRLHPTLENLEGLKGIVWSHTIYRRDLETLL
jgi:hypothetical protein